MDLRKLKTLIDLVSESNVSELEITEAEGKVRIVKGGPAAVQAVYAPAPMPAGSPAPAPALAPRPPPDWLRPGPLPLGRGWRWPCFGRGAPASSRSGVEGS